MEQTQQTTETQYERAVRESQLNEQRRQASVDEKLARLRGLLNDLDERAEIVKFVNAELQSAARRLKAAQKNHRETLREILDVIDPAPEGVANTFPGLTGELLTPLQAAEQFARDVLGVKS